MRTKHFKYLMTDKELKDTQKVARLCGLKWQALAARPKVAKELIDKWLPVDVRAK